MRRTDCFRLRGIANIGALAWTSDLRALISGISHIIQLRRSDYKQTYVLTTSHWWISLEIGKN